MRIEGCSDSWIRGQMHRRQAACWTAIATTWIRLTAAEKWDSPSSTSIKLYARQPSYSCESSKLLT